VYGFVTYPQSRHDRKTRAASPSPGEAPRCGKLAVPLPETRCSVLLE
jgi:hypothetical protein